MECENWLNFNVLSDNHEVNFRRKYIYRYLLGVKIYIDPKYEKWARKYRAAGVPLTTLFIQANVGGCHLVYYYFVKLKIKINMPGRLSNRSQLPWTEFMDAPETILLALEL